MEVSSSNTYTKTFIGIDGVEKRLANEVLQVVKKTKSLKRISFLAHSLRESVFVEVEPILRSAMDGRNVCVFAYGQTGTCKTFTMHGTNEEPRIISRALEELFRQASLDNSSSFTFTMSMLEVYMGNLKDLLSPRQSGRPHEQYMTKW
ncbi:hypothetical protein AAZX31_01G104400 [Glycine max]